MDMKTWGIPTCDPKPVNTPFRPALGEWKQGILLYYLSYYYLMTKTKTKTKTETEINRCFSTPPHTTCLGFFVSESSH